MRFRLWLVLFLGLHAFPVAAAPILSIQPSGTVVTVGQPFSVNVFVTGATDLFAYEFDVGFDPAVLSADSVEDGPFLATGGATFFIPGTIDNVAGTISFNASTLLGAISGVTGNGILAKVNFVGAGNGTSSINLFSPSLLDSSLSTLSTTVQGGSAEVTGETPPPTLVPEPSALLLVSCGLAAFGRWRRRRA